MTSCPIDSLNRHDEQTSYVGRFAPSPSGQLHFGSLIAALGSFLQARANQGLWLVRMEDIDPPREVPGAADDILRTLEQFGLHWDQSVLYQSRRLDAYSHALEWLTQNDQTYWCQCTRKHINQTRLHPGIYPRNCRDLKLQPPPGQRLEQPGYALRFKNDCPVTSFNDRLQGLVQCPLGSEQADDFIIHRKDGLYAYQLAVVVDDIAQGITEIVRGCDLLSTTLSQISLYQAFARPRVDYLHLPLAVTGPGKKLSKQNHAQPIDSTQAAPTLLRALAFLNVANTDQLAKAPVTTIIDWAIEQWPKTRLPPQQEIPLSLKYLP